MVLTNKQCEWPSDDPLIRRKNRPRKMKLHLSKREAHEASRSAGGSGAIGSSSRADVDPVATEKDKSERARTMRVPLAALQAFAATLPADKTRKGYEHGFAESLMPRTLRAGMMMDSAFLAPYFPAV
jgi:hypothetical protein